MKQIIPAARQMDNLIIDGFTIEARDSDCYINATMLCQAGHKKFAHWYSLESTKHFLEILSSDIDIRPHN